ncbi:MAG TPA: ATP-binding protein [Firmicutes bacterium]|nr:ATP-binding protein [Bacillota bacterium]
MFKIRGLIRGSRLEMLSRLDLVIADELGYMPVGIQRAHLYFQFVSCRYEKGSIILTTNKSFERWGQVFGDDVIASAVLDRLLHHSHIIAINSPSYRLKDKLNQTIAPAAVTSRRELVRGAVATS